MRLSSRSRNPNCMSDPKTITRLLHECRRDDDRDAFAALMPLVYEDLKKIARQQLRRLRPGRTLDTTALAHESYLKLKGHADLDYQDRRHFFGVVARAMRQILVDYARRKTADKRRGVELPIDLERTPENSEQRAEQIIYVHELLSQLEQIDASLVEVVECHYFAGYSQQETAEILDLSLRTVQRRWQVARAFLREFATQQGGEQTLSDQS